MMQLHEMHGITSTTFNVLPAFSCGRMFNLHCCAARWLWQAAWSPGRLVHVEPTPPHAVNALPFNVILVRLKLRNLQ
jgi:hypothetical protein